MVALVLKTCGDPGVAALVAETGVLAAEVLPGRGTSERLMPAVRKLLADAGMTVRQLGAVGVVVGPGSFTGVRVGLGAAKGLCEAVGVGMVGVSRLALVAAAGNGVGRVVAVLDGGRGEYYCGIYKDAVCLREELLDESATRACISEGLALTCEERVSERLGIPLVAEPGAETMRAVVFARAAAAEWSDVATIDANYLRRTDAELLVKAK